MISMFILTEDPTQTARAVERAGGHVGTNAGDVMTVRVPADRILEVAGDASVRRVEGGRAVQARLDKVVTEVGADAVHEGKAPLSMRYTGRGVIVGVVDLGLDFAHQAFWTRERRSRVVALWDQTTEGTPPAGYRYGTVCTTSDIERGACEHRSTEGHGTHVTGIAAGGRVAGSPHVGLAPESDIIFVNLGAAPDADGDDEATSTAICDGVAFIFRRALNFRHLPAHLRPRMTASTQRSLFLEA
jgi:subtilisin family serine protease